MPLQRPLSGWPVVPGWNRVFRKGLLFPGKRFASVDHQVRYCLDQLIRIGRFREDLYYRLNVLTIHVPPLRDRRGDIALPAQVFLSEAEKELERGKLAFAPDALEALNAYAGPGNVRELKNVILRASAMAAQDLLLARKLPRQQQEGIRLAIQGTTASSNGMSCLR